MIYSDKEILSECKLFYENLYSSFLADANVFQETFFPVQENAKILNEEEQTLCEGPLDWKECLEALRDMMPEKTPGTDGLPCEFYKVFWNDLGEILIKALNYSHVSEKLLISQRRGIIKLIPKKDAELTSIKN